MSVIVTTEADLIDAVPAAGGVTARLTDSLLAEALGILVRARVSLAVARAGALRPAGGVS